MKKKNEFCLACGEGPLTKNTIGLNKKLISSDLKSFYCLNCLAEFLSVSKEDLIEKIEEFIDEGCILFE